MKTYLKDLKLYCENIYSIKNKKGRTDDYKMKYIENQSIMANISPTISVMTLEVNSVIKSKDMYFQIGKKIHLCTVYRKYTLDSKQILKVKGWKKLYCRFNKWNDYTIIRQHEL